MPCFVGIAGAIFLLIAVKIAWLDPVGIGDVINGTDLGSHASDWKYTFTPIIAVILGIVALITMIAPLIVGGDDIQKFYDIMAVAQLVLSAVTIVLTILFATQSVHEVKITEIYHLDTGYWLTVIGATFTAFGGVMHFIRNKFFGKNWIDISPVDLRSDRAVNQPF